MKIAKKYVMFFNYELKHVFFCNYNKYYNIKIKRVIIGYPYICDFSQLKKNLKSLDSCGYKIVKQKF